MDIVTTLLEQGFQPDLIDDTDPDNVYFGFEKYRSGLAPANFLICRVSKETIADRIVTRFRYPFGRFDFVFDWNERQTITDWRYRDFPAVDAGGHLLFAVDSSVTVDRETMHYPDAHEGWSPARAFFHYSDGANEPIDLIQIVTLPQFGKVGAYYAGSYSAGDIISAESMFWYDADETQTGAYSDTFKFKVHDSSGWSVNEAIFTFEVTTSE